MRRWVLLAIVSSGLVSSSAHALCDWVPLSNGTYVNCRYVSINTSTLQSQLYLTDQLGFSVHAIIDRAGSGSNAGMIFRTQTGANTYLNGWFVGKPGGIDPADDLLVFGYASNPQSPAMALKGTGGNVGIGTTAPSEKLDVSGNIKASGSIMGGTVIGAVYQDVAEWVQASADLEPGTVVVLDPSHENQVMPSARSYDTAVAGVVSARPGLILGEGSASKEKIATVGRVKVRVDATRAPIAIGDLLVTGDKPGTAMRSEPLDVAGAKMHRPGTVLGKALQPLSSGEGEILVLLSLQ